MTLMAVTFLHTLNLNSMLRIITVSTIFALAHYSGFSQNDKFNFRYDTLSLKEILSEQSESPLYSLFDTVRVELYLGSKLIAILPKDMRQFINEAEISSIRYRYETLADNRILQRVQMFIKLPDEER